MTVGNPVVQLWYLLLDTTAHYPDEFLSQQLPFIAIFSSILSFFVVIKGTACQTVVKNDQVKACIFDHF